MRHNGLPKGTGMIAELPTGRVYASLLVVLACLTTGLLTSCSSSSLTTSPPTTIAITAKSGSPQNAAITTAFASPLVANVTSNGTPLSGVTVTFSAPGSGASCTLASATATTDASGDASTTCTADTTAGSYNVTASASGATTPASFGLTNKVVTITATSGTPQAVAINTAFPKPLVATVLDSNSNPVSGVSVTFAGPGSGASCTPTSTTVTTDASGNASTTCTANATAGDYNATASVGVAASANFSLKNGVPYAFHLSGKEIPNSHNGNTDEYYALAGAVLIDANGTVLGGEQDYNNGIGITSPQPTGDLITSGTMTAGATGQGTVTLITNNSLVGVAGTETLGVQFVNANHALIIQFDGTATSSGTMDKQTLAAPSGSYAFTLTGKDTNSAPIGYGGVFSVSSSTVTGIADVNDNGTITAGATISGTVSDADAYGRGLTSGITINGTALTLNYYIVGPEAIRVIDVDVDKGVSGTGGAAVGSAYGQGSSTTFTASSLGASVFGLEGGLAPGAFPYDTVGMLTPNAANLTFTGVMDDDEKGDVKTARVILGNYSTSNVVGGVTYNGYGNMTITPPNPYINVASLGMYMTDPALNLSDPNNSTGGGGALLLDLDATLSGGAGVVISQTDNTAASFTGNYGFGAQEIFKPGVIDEFDFVGQGSVSSLALSGTGLVSDPFAFFAASGAEYTGATFAGTATADTVNTGRYTLPLAITTTGSTQTPQMAIYQASGGLLLWIDEETTNAAFGSVQQQGSMTGLPAVRKPGAKGLLKIQTITK